MKAPDLITKSTENLLDAAVRIADQDAQDRGDLGFTARALVLCTMPHSKPAGNEFRRKNGNYTLTMLAPSDVGLPYGTIPRLLLAWISTEAVRTKSRTLVLGDSLSQFMRDLGLSPTGGVKGDITRLREQMRRLFSCFVSCNYHDKSHDITDGFKIVRRAEMWWHPNNPEQAGLWQSTLTLSEEFYEEVLSSPVPIDIHALKALRRSPLALDLYMWLTYRNSYLKEKTVITWAQLRMQLGAEYGRERAFKEAFKVALKKVQVAYPSAKIQTVDTGILIAPSPTHISRKRKTLSID
jgi:hypothetical protein